MMALVKGYRDVLGWGRNASRVDGDCEIPQAMYTKIETQNQRRKKDPRPRTSQGTHSYSIVHILQSQSQR